MTAGALSIHPEVERIVICEIEPARMKYDQVTTTASVEMSVPGSQLVFSNGFQARPRNS